MRALLLVILVVSFIGCDKDDDKGNGFSEGVYTGTFQRKTAMGGQIVDVTLILDNSTYIGHNNNLSSRYPVIGRGSYSISGGKISFVDSLFYTADFDWTLILSQEYGYSVQGDSLTITREYNGGVKDIYKLRKQNQ